MGRRPWPCSTCWSRRSRSSEVTRWCEECGGEVVEDASPGVYLHASPESPDGIDHDLDGDHVARPERQGDEAEGQ